MSESKTLQVLENIRAEMEALPGHLGFYYKDLVTGLEYGVRAHEAFLAAASSSCRFICIF